MERREPTPKEITDAVLLMAVKSLTLKCAPSSSKLFRKQWTDTVYELNRMRFSSNDALPFASMLADLVKEIVERLANAQNLESVTVMMTYLKEVAAGNVAVVEDNQQSVLLTHQIGKNTLFPGGEYVYVWNETLTTWLWMANEKDWNTFILGQPQYTHWTRLPAPAP